MQMCLSQNRAELETAGYDLAYPGRDDIPGARLRLGLPRGDVARHRIPGFADQIRRHLGKISPDAERGLILSEENIPGPMKHFYKGQFFPFCNKRFRTLFRALDGNPKHVVFVLRSYDELFVSAYRKRAEDNPVPEFESLIPAYKSIEKGWPWLLKRLRDALKPDTLTVIPYEKRGSSVDILRCLVPGLENVPLCEPQREVNLSATDTALLALQARYQAGEELSRPDWQAVIAEHAEDRGKRGFAEFDADTRQVLRDRYKGDLSWIARIPGVRFLPDGLPPAN